jgi:nucleotide-binding universal stress UspA family protein
VVGSHGRRAIERVLIGSVSIQAATHAHCPVVVVPQPKDPAAPGDVVVGVDGSPASLDAVSYAMAHAAQTGSGLTVVHGWDVGLLDGTLALNAPMEVWEAFEDERVTMVAELAAGWSEKYPEVSVHTSVVRGSAADALRLGDPGDVARTRLRSRRPVAGRSAALGQHRHPLLRRHGSGRRAG